MLAFFFFLIFLCVLLVTGFSNFIKLLFSVLSLNGSMIIVVGRYLDSKCAFLGVSWEDALSVFTMPMKRFSPGNEDSLSKKVCLEDLDSSSGGGGAFSDSPPIVPPATPNSSPAVDTVSPPLEELSGGFLGATDPLDLESVKQALLDWVRCTMFGGVDVDPSLAEEVSSSDMSSLEASSSSGMSSPEIFDSEHLKMVWDSGKSFFNGSFENLVECSGFFELSLIPYFSIFSVLVWWFKNAWFISLLFAISLWKLREFSKKGCSPFFGFSWSFSLNLGLYKCFLWWAIMSFGSTFFSLGFILYLLFLFLEV